MQHPPLISSDIEPGQDWEIFSFHPQDAPGVCRLFRSVYGDGYPIRDYIEPDRLIAANAETRIISTVARTSRGDIVGHNALFQSAVDPGIYELGAGLVHTAYRGGAGIFTRMIEHGLCQAESNPAVNTVFGEPVCNHIFTQKTMVSKHYVPRALEVDLMPASTYETEKSSSGRVAALLGFRTYRPKPHRVFLPEMYENTLRFLYSEPDDSREFQISDQPIPCDRNSDIQTTFFDFAAVARIAVHEIGSDFLSDTVRLENQLRERGVLVSQLWLKLTCPWVGQAVGILRGQGYFLGGVLWRWFNDDGLLMQKIYKIPDWEGIQVYGKRSEQIRDMIRADWEKSVGYQPEPGLDLPTEKRDRA